MFRTHVLPYAPAVLNSSPWASWLLAGCQSRQRRAQSRRRVSSPAPAASSGLPAPPAPAPAHSIAAWVCSRPRHVVIQVGGSKWAVPPQQLRRRSRYCHGCMHVRVAACSHLAPGVYRQCVDQHCRRSHPPLTSSRFASSRSASALAVACVVRTLPKIVVMPMISTAGELNAARIAMASSACGAARRQGVRLTGARRWNMSLCHRKY